MVTRGVEHSMGAGSFCEYQAQGNSEYSRLETVKSQSLGAKVQRQEGNSPDRPLRSLSRKETLNSKKG